ncbi:Myc-type, basic helix-loop-helix domain-containing protein [Tanacetum coccineum]
MEAQIKLRLHVRGIFNEGRMACVAPRSHGGDAGGSPPRRPTRPVPAQCQSSMLRLETGNRSLRKAFRENNEQPLKIGFDYEDLGTFHPLGNFSGMLNSLMGETVRPLPLACEWEEIPEAYKAHIYPTLESYFDLVEWYNKQDKVVVGRNVYTVGERVRLGLELKLRLLWRKNKNRIKADHYAKHTSPDEAKNHPPPPKVWGERTQDDWNELVDWWSQPDQVSRSLQNAANRAKNTIIAHQGKKSFAQGRNEYPDERKKSSAADAESVGDRTQDELEELVDWLVPIPKSRKAITRNSSETWRKGHSSKKIGEFKIEQNKQRYVIGFEGHLQSKIKPRHIPFKTIKKSLDEFVFSSDNRHNVSGLLWAGRDSNLRRAAKGLFASLKADQAETNGLMWLSQNTGVGGFMEP